LHKTRPTGAKPTSIKKEGEIRKNLDYGGEPNGYGKSTWE